MTQRAIPCMFMRGGTSRGPFFLLADLPADSEVRDRVLLAAMGSPDPRQIDGLGGATTVTSKVAMVSPSQRPGIDVDYRFAQVWLDKAIVDTAPSCGNMLAGVGPFAIERGLVTPDADETWVRIFDVNTGSRIEAIVQTPGGTVTYAGDQRMGGVPGTGAPVVLSFSDVVGSKCGALFPTGAVQEEIDGVPVSCIDVAMPMVIMRAGDLGLSGYDPDEITGNAVLMERIEKTRLEAGRRMGLGDVAESVVPKVGILAPRTARRRGLFVLPDAASRSCGACGDRCDLCGLLCVDPGNRCEWGRPATNRAGDRTCCGHRRACLHRASIGPDGRTRGNWGRRCGARGSACRRCSHGAQDHGWFGVSAREWFLTAAYPNAALLENAQVCTREQS